MTFNNLSFIGDSHMRGLFDLFLHQVCHDRRKYEIKKDAKVELESSIQSIVDYKEVTFLQTDLDSYKKKLESCKIDTEDCSLLENEVDINVRKHIENCMENIENEECNLFDDGCLESKVTFLDAHFCQEDISNYMKGYDYVVLNCGHHFSRVDISYNEFKYMTDSLSSKISSLQNNGGNNNFELFWLENTAHPLTQSDGNKDKSSYHRLVFLNNLALGSFKRFKLKYSIIRAFHSTLSLFDKMCDCGHYPKSARMPQLLDLLDIMQKPAI